MGNMTLREVCNDTGFSRRAIQWYEHVGLVSATSKNERGYLLYDEVAQARLNKIRLFQKMGFTIKEISQIIDAPNHILKKALADREKKLRTSITQSTEMIQIIQEMIQKL